jgi:uncharacterized protein YcbX
MQGVAIDEAQVSWAGLAGDRRYAFVRDGNRSHFPWLTGRELPDLLRYQPYMADGADPTKADLRVVTPTGSDLALDDAALAAALAADYGGPVTLLQSGRGLQDSAPVSLLGLATVDYLSQQVGTVLETVRFRPNIVVEAANGEPFAEDDWLGALLVFGAGDDGARLRVNRKDPRCMMVNLDPVTVEQNPAVLRQIVREREKCTGIYAAVEQPGLVRVGDVIRLLRQH